MQQVKKHQNKNEYVLTRTGLWVRNFTNAIKPIDINCLTERSDYQVLTENEIAVKSLNIPELGSESFHFNSCVIVSDGFGFDTYKSLLVDLPKDVCIIGANRSLAKWQTADGLLKRQMNFFLANNPYSSCMSLMPKHRYFPSCIVSNRTNHSFVQNYGGTLYRYTPVFEQGFAGLTGGYYQIDDYRNPICAAIGVAYRFHAKKVALFCCDDSFSGERPAAEQLPNGLWMYPQHKTSHSLIEGSLHWLRSADIEVKDFSSGPSYINVATAPHNELKLFLGK